VHVRISRPVLCGHKGRNVSFIVTENKDTGAVLFSDRELVRSRPQAYPWSHSLVE